MIEATAGAPDSSAKGQPEHDRPEALQISLLYSHLPASQAVAVANAVVLAIVLSYVIEPVAIVGWFAALIFVTLARIYLYALFRRASRSASDVSVWRTYFLVGALASGLVWGSTALLLYPPESFIHQILIAFLLGGMVVGAAATLTSVFLAFVLFATSALLPMIARYFIAGDHIHNAMGGMAVFFLLAMLVIGKRIHDTIAESLKLRSENQELIVYLTNTSEHFASMNNDLIQTQDKLTRANEALEQRVAERTAALQMADRRKDEFLAMLSHELRNPLAAIGNIAAILTGGHVQQPHSKALYEMLQRQTRQLTRIVDDLLDVARITQGNIPIRKQLVRLDQVVQRAAVEARPAMDAKGHRFYVRAEDEVLVEGDEVRLIQVVTNLLDNAAKYTEAGGRIELSLVGAANDAVMRVRDTAPHINPEFLPHIFELFAQDPATLDRSQGGLGIGLTVVKKIVEMHDGSVEVRSEQHEQGNEFVVRLPRVPARSGLTLGSEPHAPSEHPTQLRILLVEDNRDAAESLAMLLRTRGYDVHLAYDGKEGLLKAETVNPDVIVLDIGLPEMSGYDVCRAVRKQTRGKDTRIVALTGWGQESHRRESVQAGFDAHLVKPVEEQALLSVLGSPWPRQPQKEG